MQMLKTSVYKEEAHVKAIVMRSNTSFYWAMRLLPREKRTAMFAIYAFCRDVDDIADESGTVQYKRLCLQKRRTEIVETFDGNPNNPLDALDGSDREFPVENRDKIIFKPRVSPDFRLLQIRFTVVNVRRVKVSYKTNTVTSQLVCL